MERRGRLFLPGTSVVGPRAEAVVRFRSARPLCVELETLTREDPRFLFTVTADSECVRVHDKKPRLGRTDVLSLLLPLWRIYVRVIYVY